MAVSSSPTLQYQVLVVTAGLTFLAGFLINVFIVAVNICEWKKGRPVSTTDKVITSLGITRMVFQGVCLLHIIYKLHPNRLSILSILMVTFLQFTSVYSNIWLSTLLSIVFYLKISTLNNALFLLLKHLVFNRVFLLMITSVVVSVSYAFTLCLVIDLKISQLQPITNFNNSTSTNKTYSNILYGLWLLMLIFFSTGPFLIYFISSALLIFYLYHHIRRMKSKSNGTSRLDTYYKTIKFTGFSLFCSTFFIIIDNIDQYCYDVFGFFGFYLIWQIFPTLHSIYLIYVSVKLRSQVSNMVRLVKRRCHNPKAQVETVS